MELWLMLLLVIILAGILGAEAFSWFLWWLFRD